MCILVRAQVHLYYEHCTNSKHNKYTLPHNTGAPVAGLTEAIGQGITINYFTVQDIIIIIIIVFIAYIIVYGVTVGYTVCVRYILSACPCLRQS